MRIKFIQIIFFSHCLQRQNICFKLKSNKSKIQTQYPPLDIPHGPQTTKKNKNVMQPKQAVMVKPLKRRNIRRASQSDAVSQMRLMSGRVFLVLGQLPANMKMNELNFFPVSLQNAGFFIFSQQLLVAILGYVRLSIR